MDEQIVQFRWINEQASRDLSPPAYETGGAAGMDVEAGVDGKLVIEPGARALVPTGVQVAVPEGYELQVRPRSGLAVNHGVTIINSPGTIDSDYRGEVKVGLVNLGDEPYTVQRGDRIAQLVLAPVSRACLMRVTTLDRTERGAGGFGHTGL